jgi:hypothetical protein
MKTLAHDGRVLHDALLDLGAEPEFCSRLSSFLSSHHPGGASRLYHNLEHSLEVAGLTARCVGALMPPLPPSRRVLLVFAAALHDVDPSRVPGTPPRIEATLAGLNERAALRLVADFGERWNFTRGQVAALILATAHDTDPQRLNEQRALFRAAARGAFPDDPEALEWGRALAYWDKAATYVAEPELARRRVVGLARELRAAAGGRGPSDAELLAGTPRFLAALRRDPLFGTLPLADRARFDATAASFAPDA